MKTVTKKVRLWLDAYPMNSITEDPIISAYQVRQGNWISNIVENGLRSIVEIEMQIPVLVEEIELPPARAIAERLRSPASGDKQDALVGRKDQP
jgi:uncharacterized small protein (DUF1192 family)